MSMAMSHLIPETKPYEAHFVLVFACRNRVFLIHFWSIAYSHRTIDLYNESMMSKGV